MVNSLLALWPANKRIWFPNGAGSRIEGMNTRDIDAGIDRGATRKQLLRVACLFVGAIIALRGLLNIFGHPAEFISIVDHIPILDRFIRYPISNVNWLLGLFFIGSLVGIGLMWFERRGGWWLFTIVNLLVGLWLIRFVDGAWLKNILPHAVLAGLFVPFLVGMQRTRYLSRALKPIFSFLGKRFVMLLGIPVIGALVMRFPWIHERLNKFMINRIVDVARSRPHPFSTQSSYSSWSSLTDRSWSGRHLGVSSIDQCSLPRWEGENGLRQLFERPVEGQRMCPKSTLLFASFAQYLTDGFLRTLPEENPDNRCDKDPNRRKRNNSNHQIDLCPLYGRTAEQTKVLRVQNPTNAERGKLRSQTEHGEEFPPFLFKDGKRDPDFSALDTPLGLSSLEEKCNSENAEEAMGARALRDRIFAVGGDRVNSVPQVSLMNTLWLREHNRLATEIGLLYPKWDDDQVFEVSRNIVIAQFITVVVEDYINHIAPLAVNLMAKSDVAWNAPWNKPNWITTEFSLLYRWHALIPDAIKWGGKPYSMGPGYFMNNIPLLESGLQKAFEELSSQAAGELGPRNTNEHLLDVEMNSIRQGRICELRSYNDYREYLKLGTAKKFSDISKDPMVWKQLEKAYNSVDEVDFFVGIFCEDRIKNSPLPETIFAFVALDAFSQALTNPLLSEHVFKNETDDDHPTFTNYGLAQLNSCKSLRDVVQRNIGPAGELGFVGMTLEGWSPI